MQNTPQSNPPIPPLVNLAALARELATDILPIHQIMERNKITPEVWERVERDPNFQRMLHDYINEWNAAGNSRTRIKAKALSAIEMTMESIALGVLDISNPLTQRVDAIRQLARLGELEGKQELGGGGSDRVNITINIGQGKPPMTIDAQRAPLPVEETIDG